MFLVYNGYKIQNFICDNEFSLNKDCFISFVIVVQKKLDQSLPLIVYSLKGACALKGCLCPKRVLTSRLRGSDGAEWFVIPANAGNQNIKTEQGIEVI
jgi:hypothetical protein